MNIQCFFVFLLCFSATSTTLLERAKRICQQAAHNWRLIQNFSPKKAFLPTPNNMPLIRKKSHNPFFLKVESKVKPVDMNSFECHEEFTTVCIDDVPTTQHKERKFQLLHRIHRTEEILETDYDISETEITYSDYDEDEEFYDIIDIFDIHTNTDDNLYYYDNEE